MDPSSDSPLHFRHQHHQGQRPQRLGSTQPSGSMSSPSSTHNPTPASPPTSTAASSNPFVRSHHDDLPAPLVDSRPSASEPHRSARSSSIGPSRSASSSAASETDNIFVAIKCPSLDKDSAVVQVKATDTVLALKQTIEATWAGAPRAAGMRCIRSGRILSDVEILGQLREGLDEGEPLSLHLVIRPDAWSDPQNRPTPSRRSSYLRQQQQQQQQLQHQHQHSLLRSALTPSTVPHDNVDDDMPPVHSATSTEHPPNWTPAFAPYFTEPDPTPTQSLPDGTASESGMLASGSNIDMIDSVTDQVGADAYGVLEETLRVTAPENWPLLVEALSAACDEYVLLYERIYDESQAAQQNTSDPTPATRFKQSDLLTSVETTLLGWDAIREPNEEDAVPGLAAPEYVYQQVSHRGLPYLVCVATTSLAVQRSEALYMLLQRITTLRAMIDKLENVTMLGRLIQVQRPASATTPGAPDAVAQVRPNGIAAAAGRGLALGQGGLVAGLTRASQRASEAVRGITFADVSGVVIPLFFVGFKVGILLSVMLRGADTVKKYFVLGMASVYVAFESYRIVQRRMRVRQRQAPRAPAPRAVPADEAVHAAEAAPAPVGANVPSAPSHEEAVERQATEEPLRPLPAPQAPERGRARRWTYDWWIDRLAFLGLESEDAELGLLPAPTTRRAEPNLVEQVLGSSWILPLVLFVVTMMPAVEQRRKRAIEERERVIRKWTRLEEERRARADELLQKQHEGSATTSVEMVGGDRELQQKRVEYADRILRQRRTTEPVDVDEDEFVAQRLQEEDEEGMEDMNIF